jgi:hypothetical protein
MNLNMLSNFMQVLNIIRSIIPIMNIFIGIFYLLRFIYCRNRNQILKIILSRK